MADEILKRDPNRAIVEGFITNDASLEVMMGRIDPSTKRILVDAVATASSGMADNAAFTAGTSLFFPGGFFVDEVATSSITENSAGAARMTPDRKQINASEFKEDTAYVSGDYGTQVLAVRNDAATALAADGDYTALQTDSIGRLRVTGGGTSNVDDSAFGIATDSVVPVGMLADETGTDSVNEGDVGISRMTLDRKAIGASNFTEDSVHVSGDYGTQVLAVRNDAGTALAADGDYTSLQTDSTGALRVTGAAAFIDDAVFTPAVTGVTPIAFIADETGTDSIDEGDAGAARMTLNRRQIMAGSVLDDAAFGIGTEYSLASGFLADESATDSVDEGDLGVARMTLDRKQIVAGTFLEDSVHVSGDYGIQMLAVRNDASTSLAANGDYTSLQTDSVGALRTTDAKGLTDDSAFTVGTSMVEPCGFLADEVSTDLVDEGDIGVGRMSLRRAVYTTMDTLLAGEDQANGVLACVEKPLAVATYTPSMDTSAAAEASSVTKASAGNIYGFTATNSSGSTRYFQFFNSTTVPADTTVPVLSYFCAAGGTVSDMWSKGRNFSTGIAWAWSSTAATKTIGSTDGIATVGYL